MNKLMQMVQGMFRDREIGEWEQYRQILARSASPKKDDAATLARLMETLGLTMAQVQEHAAAIEAHDSQQAIAALLPKATARREAAERASAAHEAETHRLIQERRDGLDPLLEEAREARAAEDRASWAARAVDEMRQKNRQLFRVPEPLVIGPRSPIEDEAVQLSGVLPDDDLARDAAIQAKMIELEVTRRAAMPEADLVNALSSLMPARKRARLERDGVDLSDYRDPDVPALVKAGIAARDGNWRRLLDEVYAKEAAALGVKVPARSAVEAEVERELLIKGINPLASVHEWEVKVRDRMQSRIRQQMAGEGKPEGEIILRLRNLEAHPCIVRARARTSGAA